MPKKEENFDSQFKKLIKSIIEEEGYFKEENIKKLMDDLIEAIDPLIAKHVKEHFSAIGEFMIKKNNPPIEIIETDEGENKDA